MTVLEREEEEGAAEARLRGTLVIPHLSDALWKKYPQLKHSLYEKSD